ncbi:MAG: enoyl-CoA hydratase/isomerase family protein [Acidimicrobiia bacterium]|nr:enoyl-CoA hydratase/isomerase family protein [Acidimicrobiia bacterium]
MLHLERTDDAVYVIHMRSGENRINRSWVDGMHTFLDQIEGDAEAHAVVTTGEDRFFSSGLDLDWLGTGEEDFRSFVADAEKLFARLLAFPLNTVAACNGHTYAAGAMFSLCHDFRVMRADRGFWCLPEVDIGLPFTPGMDSLIKTRLPITTAHDVMVTGDRYGGTDAAAKGIVHEAVAESDVLPRSMELARHVGGKDRVTLAAVKQRMNGRTIELLADSPGTGPAT